MGPSSWLVLVATLIALAACARGADDASGVTTDEQRQLNEAAAGLDASAGLANVGGPDANVAADDLPADGQPKDQP